MFNMVVRSRSGHSLQAGSLRPTRTYSIFKQLCNLGTLQLRSFPFVQHIHISTEPVIGIFSICLICLTFLICRICRICRVCEVRIENLSQRGRDAKGRKAKMQRGSERNALGCAVEFSLSGISVIIACRRQQNDCEPRALEQSSKPAAPTGAKIRRNFVWLTLFRGK